MFTIQRIAKWLTPGIGIKRWFLLAQLGSVLFATALILAGLKFLAPRTIGNLFREVTISHIVLILTSGALISSLGIVKLARNLLAPYRKHQHGHIIDVVSAHSKQRKGIRVVAIGGGTGLPSVLRGLKPYTNHITAVVTVADDGGSSGRLRRELGVLPPGDLRNNIAALADAESLMTRLFQYRFDRGDLQGHAFGNLFIAALAAVVEEDGSGSIPEALTEIERVLNIQGRVLPATLEDVNLIAKIRMKDTNRVINIQGESQISVIEGTIEDILLDPSNAAAYTPSVEAILKAEVIVIGPGSLYTSILPNLMVKGIADALRATSAYKIYVCNVATQPGETSGFTVAEHVSALERYIGRGVFQVVLANNAYPPLEAGSKTLYVRPVPDNHEITQRYELHYTDLVDDNFPWRHAPNKLAAAILDISNEERLGGVTTPAPVLADIYDS